jgi:hypothetical protein
MALLQEWPAGSMRARSRYAFKQPKKNQEGLKKSLVHRPK